MSPFVKVGVFLLLSLPMLAVVALGIVGGVVMHSGDVVAIGFTVGLLVGLASILVGAEMFDPYHR